MYKINNFKQIHSNFVSCIVHVYTIFLHIQTFSLCFVILDQNLIDDAYIEKNKMYLKLCKTRLSVSFTFMLTESSEATDVTPINTGRSSQREGLPDFGGHSPIRDKPPTDEDENGNRPHGKCLNFRAFTKKKKTTYYYKAHGTELLLL